MLNPPVLWHAHTEDTSVNYSPHYERTSSKGGRLCLVLLTMGKFCICYCLWTKSIREMGKRYQYRGYLYEALHEFNWQMIPDDSLENNFWNCIDIFFAIYYILRIWWCVTYHDTGLMIQSNFGLQQLLRRKTSAYLAVRCSNFFSS